MNKEQKEAIEYYQNKEVSLSVDFDTEKLLKALGITEEDSFENHQIRFKTLLNLIEKLQKENEKYKQFFDLMLILDSDYFMNCGDEETNKLVDEILKLESE